LHKVKSRAPSSEGKKGQDNNLHFYNDYVAANLNNKIYLFTVWQSNGVTLNSTVSKNTIIKKRMLLIRLKSVKPVISNSFPKQKLH
jgi:hypothetical protein